MEENFEHPEKKKDEIWIMNVKEGETWWNAHPDWIARMRAGVRAYTRAGEYVPGYKPIFATLIKKKNERAHRPVSSNHSTFSNIG